MEKANLVKVGNKTIIYLIYNFFVSEKSTTQHKALTSM